jgi:predicted RNA binding protein YcfA (HicA-like mRNA interferase family)
MAKAEKIIERILANPVPANIKWDELVLVLNHLGYRTLHKDGSRRRFHQEKIDHVICLHRPHPGNEVKPVYIRQMREVLKELGLIPTEKS